jgi:hypothetical protein
MYDFFMKTSIILNTFKSRSLYLVTTTTANSGVSGVSRVPSTTSSHNESVYTIHSVTGETINSKIQ